MDFSSTNTFLPPPPPVFPVAPLLLLDLVAVGAPLLSLRLVPEAAPPRGGAAGGALVIMTVRGLERIARSALSITDLCAEKENCLNLHINLFFSKTGVAVREGAQHH